MAKSKLTAPILREIDRQKIIQFLYSGEDFGICFSVRFRDEQALEEEERKWRESIQKLKEMLAEYQKMHGGMPT